MQRKPIQSRTYDFSESDVDVCESLEQLRDWHNKVSIDIQAMEGKLERAKNQKEKGETIDDKWIDRLRRALGIQKELRKRIEIRAAKLREDQKNPFYIEAKMEEELSKRYPQIHDEILTIARMGDGTE